MPRLRVHNLAISVDGYASGPNQSLDNPLGVGGSALHEWAFATRTGRVMHGMDGGEAGVGGADVRVGGGAATVQQYLRAGLIDEIHLAIVPILLGSGERLFDHLDGGPEGYECVEFVSSPSVAHLRFRRATK
jgi:hypothetical protein